MRCAISTASLGRQDGFVVAGDGVHAGGQGQLLGGDLVAHGRDGVVLGADEDQAFFLDAACEGLVLGQKAVARVNGLGAGRFGRLDDLVGQQVALAAGRRADADGLVGQLRHVTRERVRLGVHGHGGCPGLRAVAMTRQAISPRLAIRILVNICSLLCRESVCWLRS
jgi:hypothetical protein